MNQKRLINTILAIAAIVIIGAAGYFVLTRKDETQLKTEMGTGETQTKKEHELPLVKIKECPSASERARMNGIIGEPGGDDVFPPAYNEWVYQSFERLYVEFNKNPIRCDIDERFQIVIRIDKPKKSPEKNVSILPAMNAYLYDKNLNDEQLIAADLSWAGPMPQGNTYGPDYFTFEFKPHNLIEISYFGQPFIGVVVVDFLSKKKGSYSLSCGEMSPHDCALTVGKDSKKWVIRLLTEQNRTQKGVVKVIKGLVLNDKIFRPINSEKTYSSDFGFDSFGFGLEITNVKFDDDFSKISFNAKISGLPPKEAELGKIEISLENGK